MTDEGLTGEGPAGEALTSDALTSDAVGPPVVRNAPGYLAFALGFVSLLLTVGSLGVLAASTHASRASEVTFFLGIALAAPAIVFGGIGRYRARRSRATNRALATMGIVFACATIVVAFISISAALAVQ